MSLDISNVNYSEISRKSGLSLSFVSLVFRGLRRPSSDAVLKLSKVLTDIKGVPIGMEELHGVLADIRERQKPMVAVNG